MNTSECLCKKMLTTLLSPLHFWLVLTSNFISAKQHETNPLLSNQLPYNNIAPESKFHRNSMWGTCKIVLVHDTCHLCTRLRTDGKKAMSHGFSGGKQVINFSNKSRSSLFILDNRKWTTFYDNRKLGVKVIIFSFFGCSSSSRCPHSKQ